MAQPRFSQVLYEFESYLAVERNLSPGTRHAYVYDVDRFAEHLIVKYKKMPALHAIVPDDIRGYLQRLQERRQLKSTTLSRTISSIRRFFDFCVQREYLSTSPAGPIENPKTPKRLPVYLIANELKRLLSTPDQSSWRGKRDVAILVALGFTGMRLKELIGLDFDDIDFTTGQIRVMGKGSKERVIPMNKAVAEALKAYLRERPASPEAAVFLGRGGRRIAPRTVETVVEKYAKEAGVYRKGLSPHKLRHTFATLLHMKDVDILEIQSLLGHSSITSTQIYTHTHPGRLKSAVDKLSDI